MRFAERMDRFGEGIFSKLLEIKRQKEERAEKSLEFKEMLERRTGLPVVMWDERLTTVEADRTMMETGIRRENRKEYVDMIAAVFILQGYLDYLSHQKESQEN